MTRFLLVCMGFCAIAPCISAAASPPSMEAGFSAVDITPQIGKKPVFMAGYGMNRRATGVHDPLFARTVVLASGDQRIAICSVDLVGLQYPAVKAIRARLPQYKYVLV